MIIDSAQTPKAGMRRSAKLICYIFAAVFAVLLVVFAVLAIKGFVDYANYLNSDFCAGMDKANGLGQSFNASELQSLAAKEAAAVYGESTVSESPTLIEAVKTTILSKYTLVNGIYYYNSILAANPTEYWVFAGISVYSAIALAIQIYVSMRNEKADYTEYYTMIVLLFATLNVPSAVLMICGRKD